METLIVIVAALVSGIAGAVIGFEYRPIYDRRKEKAYQEQLKQTEAKERERKCDVHRVVRTNT
jgi:hypothetical protein